MERLGVELLACLDWVCSYWGSQPNRTKPWYSQYVTVRSRIAQIHLQKGNFTSTNSTEESARIHRSEEKLLNICLHSRWGTQFCFKMLNANKLLQVTFYCFISISFQPCPRKKQNPVEITLHRDKTLGVLKAQKAESWDSNDWHRTQSIGHCHH